MSNENRLRQACKEISAIIDKYDMIGVLVLNDGSENLRSVWHRNASWGNSKYIEESNVDEKERVKRAKIYLRSLIMVRDVAHKVANDIDAELKKGGLVIGDMTKEVTP